MNKAEKFFLLLNPLRSFVDYYVLPSGLMSLHSFVQKNGYNGDIIDFNTIINEHNSKDYKKIFTFLFINIIYDNMNLFNINRELIFHEMFSVWG